MRIFRLEQLGTKKSLENLVVVIGVAVWNVADLVLIAVMARLSTVCLICSVSASQTLLGKDKLLLFKIESESIVRLPLCNEAVILDGLCLCSHGELRNFSVHLCIELGQGICKRHAWTLHRFDAMLLHIQILQAASRMEDVVVLLRLVKATLIGGTSCVLI